MVLGPSWPNPTPGFLRPHSSRPPLEGLDNAHAPLFRTSSQNLSNPWSSTDQNIALITPWLARGALSLAPPPVGVSQPLGPAPDGATPPQVLQRFHLPLGLQAVAGKRGPPGAGAGDSGPNSYRPSRPRP